MYFARLIEARRKKLAKMSRSKTITVWNLLPVITIHQGRYTSKHRLNLFSLGFKFGEFSKTRKPFFFRTKKKR